MTGLPEPGRSAALARGTSVGRYFVLELLGQGGMGEVYAAFDPQLDRRVALKLLLRNRSAPAAPGPESADGGPTVSDGPVELGQARLLREAQAMARLAHPNVLAVHDAGTHLGQVFIAMELVEGRTLRLWLKETPRARREVLEAFFAAGRGLAAAHAAGIVHRDFKPDNVLVGPQARVRVTDFGLARAEGETEPPAAEALLPDPVSRPLDATLTRTGALLGTPAFMAPEQLAGGPSTALSDQFSFCVSLYEGLCGHRPWDEAGLRALAISRMDAARGRPASPPPPKPPPPERPIPRWLLRALERGLDADPARRFASMDALLAALAADPSARRRRALGASALALTVAALATGAWRYAARDVCAGAESRLAGVWDGAVRERVERAFLDRGGELGADALRTTSERLDAWAAGWAGMHREACLSTRARQEQPETVLALRMSCLERRLDGARALTALLAEADGPLVARAVDAADGLPRLEPCANVEALGAVVPPPEGGDAAQRVNEGRRLLAEGQALLDAGRFAQVAPLARAALERAREAGYRPLEAEAQLLLGWAHSRAAEHEASSGAWAEALWAALAGRHDEVAVRAASQLVYVRGWELSHYESAHAWAQQARALLERFGRDLDLEAAAENSFGILAWAEGRMTDAAAHYGRALELRRGLFGDGHLAVARVQSNLALVEAELGRLEEADALHAQAHQTRLALLGPHHPDLAIGLVQRSGLQRALGQFDAAGAGLAAALALRERALGPQHVSAFRLHSDLGRLHDARKDLPAARAAHDRAVETARAALGDAHRETAVSHQLYADSLLRLEQFDEALARYGEAERIFLALEGPSGPFVLWIREEKAAALAGLGRHREALALAGGVLAMKEAADGPRHPQLVPSLVRVAQAERGLGRPERARAALERALDIAAPLGWSDQDLAELELELAKALWALAPHRPRALELARKAKDAFTDGGPVWAEDVQQAEAWLTSASQ